MLGYDRSIFSQARLFPNRSPVHLEVNGSVTAECPFKPIVPFRALLRFHFSQFSRLFSRVNSLQFIRLDGFSPIFAFISSESFHSFRCELGNGNSSISDFESVHFHFHCLRFYFADCHHIPHPHCAGVFSLLFRHGSGIPSNGCKPTQLVSRNSLVCTPSVGLLTRSGSPAASQPIQPSAGLFFPSPAVNPTHRIIVGSPDWPRMDDIWRSAPWPTNHLSPSALPF